MIFRAVAVLGPILLASPFALAGGGHLDVMAPRCEQDDFKGRPSIVVERYFKSTGGDSRELMYTKKRAYDAAGNGIRFEKRDSSGLGVEYEAFEYNAYGTWKSLVEYEEAETAVSYRIFIDRGSRRIAKVNQDNKEAEYLSYSEQGFEKESRTETSDGRVLEKTTVERNSDNREVRLLVEEPEGTQATEVLIEWSPEGFQTKETMIMHKTDGDKFVFLFEYPKVDGSGNWLTRVKKTELHRPGGSVIPLRDEITEREISYHPPPDPVEAEKPEE